MGDELLTLEEVAQELRVSVDTLYRWRYQGIGPESVRISGTVRVRRSALEAFIESSAEQRRPAAIG